MRDHSTSHFQNAELRALSESMRGVNLPSGGGHANDHQPHSHQGPASRTNDFCSVCDDEEQQQQMKQSQTQQRRYEQQQRGGGGGDSLSSFDPYASQHSHLSSHSHSHPRPPPPPSSLGLSTPFNVGPDESLLYSSQPSRAVLSALRSLQDKLQELRVEKASVENTVMRLEQDLAKRDYDWSKKLESAQRETTQRVAESEEASAHRQKEWREKEEKLQSQLHKLDADVRMYRDQSSARESDLKSLRDEMHHLRLKVNDAELALAKEQAAVGAARREVELEQALRTEKELEITRLKNEMNKVSELLHQSQLQVQQLHAALALEHEARASEETRAQTDKETLERLSNDLKMVSKDLLAERQTKQELINFKYRTRDYVTSLLNLNYELSIDVGMSVRKRNDLLKHSQDLLHGLKKASWSHQDDDIDHAFEEASPLAMGVTTADIRQNGKSEPSPPHSPVRSNKTMVLNGVHTQIDEQKYLLAGASSPEAIRILHPDTRDNSLTSETDDSDSDDGLTDLPVSIRVPTTPTVASLAKAGNPSQRRASAATKSREHCHTLQQREIPLPYTIGRSTKQSFSVPVNVQEILSKQPSYYSKVAAKQVAQQRRRASQGGANYMTVEEERIIVQPPTPHVSTFSESSSDAPSHLEPISLAAHSVGLATVIQHLEGEVEQLNRDYIYHLEHTRRDGEIEKQMLHKKLQSILKAIEKKNKQIDLLK